MKKATLTTLLSLVVFLASGCVQMHMDVDIEPDGSGTLTMNVSLSEALTESLDDLQSLNMGEDMEGMDVLMGADKAALEDRVKEYGVTVTKFEKGMDGGKQTVNLVMAFKDIEGMSFAMRELSQDADTGKAIVDNGDGTYTLKDHDYGWPPLEDEGEETTIETEMPQMDPEQMGKQMEIMGKLMSTMSELEIRMRVTVPGEIVSSNAPEVEGRTSIWTIDSTNMMGESPDMDPVITFKAEGLKLKAIKE